jgi:hypothetical protein
MSRLREALMKYGLVEAEPTAASQPPNVYRVLGLVNLALAAFKPRRDAG